MKQFYFLTLFCIFSIVAVAQDPFVSRWVVGNGQTILVPVVATSNTNYNIDFGDGTALTGQTGPAEHTYSVAGNYIITISGSVDHICFGDYPMSAINIDGIIQWGDMQWKSMRSAFEGCNSLSFTATDLPDLSQVTDMSFMFKNVAFSLSNYDLSSWDISHVTNVEGLFQNSSLYSDVGNWDVSNVTNMKDMFNGSAWFDQDLYSWDVSNVTNMEGLFSGTAMSHPIGNWDVSNVTTMKLMFFADEYFNQPLNGWNVSSVTDMSSMFFRAEAFNQPLDNWDVSNVTNMSGMFGFAVGFGDTGSFNQPLNGWDVSHVTDMSYMFQSSAFNQPLDNWDTSSVTNMRSMFRDADAFNQPLENWDVSNVTQMQYMFSSTLLFNQPLENWDVSHVTDMNNMFERTVAFNQPLGNWDVSSVMNMNSMFLLSSFVQPLDSWNVSQVTNMNSMFKDNTAFNQPLGSWDVSSVTVMTNMFSGAAAFNQDLSAWDFNFGGNGFQFVNMLSNSGMDSPNYDALLWKLAQSDEGSVYIGAAGVYYCDPAPHDYLVNERGWTLIDAGQGGECIGNQVFGNVFYDENTDGCTITDAPLVNYMVRATSNGQSTISSAVSETGQYAMEIFNDSCTLSVLNVPAYFTVTPAFPTVNFSGTDEQVDFCLSSNQTVADLNVALLPIDEARPGFISQYRLVAENLGTQNASNVTLTVNFDATKQSFSNADMTPSFVSAGQLIFNLDELHPLQRKIIGIAMQTQQPPVVNGGDQLVFTANIAPNNNDSTPQDNSVSVIQEVVNSYDPNDKRVVQGETVHIDNAGRYLEYMVRFQNTGSASAINVRLLDVLDPNLNWNTFTPVSASHHYTVQITDGNRVTVLFNGIHLPDATSNEAQSHGFFTFKIKPIAGIAVGDVVAGRTEIYFDFNAPIVTNSVQTTFVDQLGTIDPASQGLTVYPNPTKGMVRVAVPTGVLISEIAIYNLLGEKIKSFRERLDTVDVSDLNSGLYLISVKSSQGQFVSRLVRE